MTKKTSPIIKMALKITLKPNSHKLIYNNKNKIMNNNTYTIIDIADLDSVDFSEVHETSAETTRNR